MWCICHRIYHTLFQKSVCATACIDLWTRYIINSWSVAWQQRTCAHWRASARNDPQMTLIWPQMHPHMTLKWPHMTSKWPWNDPQMTHMKFRTLKKKKKRRFCFNFFEISISIFRSRISDLRSWICSQLLIFPSYFQILKCFVLNIYFEVFNIFLLYLNEMIRNTFPQVF